MSEINGTTLIQSCPICEPSSSLPLVIVSILLMIVTGTLIATLYWKRLKLQEVKTQENHQESRIDKTENPATLNPENEDYTAGESLFGRTFRRQSYDKIIYVDVDKMENF